MKISFIAAVVESIFNNGKVQTVGRRLDRRDFAQYATAAAGDIIRKLFYENRNLDGDTTSFLAGSVEVKVVEIAKLGHGRRGIDEKIFQLPRNLGIFGVYPIINCEGEEVIDSNNAFSRVETGSRWYYTDERIDDLGLLAYTVSMGKPELFCPKDIKKVAIEAVYKDDDLDLPEYAAYAVINAVLGSTLRVAGFPVDMRAEGDPNVKIVNETVKNALVA